jgi:hypothetical protein
MQTNFLLCITCRDLSLSSESYADCLERARAIFAACRGGGGVVTE